jgi:hypothetical protein
MLFKDLWWLIRRYWLAIVIVTLIASQLLTWRAVVNLNGDVNYLRWRTLKTSPEGH